MEYRKEIDGLRALAVIPVILFHAGFTAFSGGFVGVDIFFVISGYLITSLIITDLKAESFSLIKFYERRARRILPALFFVLLICLPFAWLFLLPSDLNKFAKSLIAVPTFTSNILFWRWSGYFDIASELKPLIHTWSLAIEEQFYLFFPILLLIIWRQRNNNFLFFILLAMAILSFSLGQYFSIDRPFFAFFLLPTRAWELLLGSLLAVHCSRNDNFKFGKPMLEIFSLIGIFGIGFSVFYFSKQTPTPSFFTLIPTLSTILLIYSANQSTIVGKLLSTRPLVGIGLLSYSAYLWHQPLIAFLKHNVDGRNELLYASIAFLTFLLALISWKYIETPFRNGTKFSRQFIFKSSIIVSFFFIFVGIIGVVTDGFAQRFSALDRELAELDVFEQGRYVDKRFLSLQGKPFKEDGRKKIILIGDSFAKDLTNVVFESKLVNSFQISTHFISANCGNLFQPFNIDKFVPKDQLSACIKNGWYGEKSVQNQLLEADEIWLASDWPYWVAEKLNESIEKLESHFNKKVIVFGIKNFGQVTSKRLLQIPYEQRIYLNQHPSNEKKRVAAFMKDAIAPEKHADLMGLLCDENYACGLFDKNGKILTHDGTHLTQAGAMYLGAKLEPILIK